MKSAAFSIALFWTASALALTPAQRITPQLEVQQISLSSIRDGVVSFFDESRSLRHESVHQFVALRAIGGRAVQRVSDLAMVVLDDGQRLAGRWEGVSEEGQLIRWRHPLLGEFDLPLDRIVRIEWVSGVALENDRADVIVLRNGDKVRGFVSEVANDSITILPDGAETSVTLRLDRIEQMQLGNPPRPSSTVYHRVVLVDDSRLNVLELEMAGQRLKLMPVLTGSRSQVTQLAVDQLVQIDFTGAGYELVDLTQLPMQVIRESKVFGLVFEPRIESGRFHAHAPATVRFDLPDSAQRLSAIAELDVDATVDPKRLDWAEFELIIRMDDEEVGRWRISDQQRRVVVNVVLPQGAAHLTLELDSSVNGPILDRLSLHHAAVLCVRPTSGH